MRGTAPDAAAIAEGMVTNVKENQAASHYCKAGRGQTARYFQL